jgi:hypothetical protein
MVHSVESLPLAVELAAALDRLRWVRAALAEHGAPLAPVVEETDHVLAMGEQILVREEALRLDTG